jgi:uncharacterized protein (TIGR00730 family)
MPTVTVFCSSSPRTPRVYLDDAAAVGKLLAEAGCEVVTGAGGTGCMQAVIDACLGAGGRARGVILRRFLEDGVEHPELTEMVVTETMRERKRLLGEEVDAYLVLPGGPGTWEEFWEVAVERQLETHARPVVVANTAGYYEAFVAQAKRALTEGFLYGTIDDLFAVEPDGPSAVRRVLEALSRS